MHILLVENSGLDFYTSRLTYAHYLQNKQYQVSVLIPDDGYAEKISTTGLKVFTYQVSKSRNWIGGIMKLLTGYRSILGSHRFDVVHSYRFFPNLFNVITSGFSSRQVVLHVTGLGIVYAGKAFKYRLYKIFSSLLYFLMIRLADHVIVQNPDDQKQLSFTSLLGRKIQLIKGSGVNTQLFSFDAALRQAIRKKAGFSEDQVLFFCITRLIWEKGIREMVDAFRSVVSDFPQVKLIIVGDPDLSNPAHVSPAYMATENHGNVLFWGKQSNVHELLSVADVFIFPSYYREGIPRGLLEALSSGLPIITTRMPGCDLTVVENGNGILIEPRSAAAIAQAIRQLMSQQSEFKKMGMMSRELALTNFSEEKIFAAIKEVYELS
jgi:glycosyltransferase involved in cell wall biosynthesis